MKRTLIALALLTACSSTNTDITPAAPLAPSAPSILRPEKLREIDATIERAIADHKLPGGVVWVEHDGSTYHRAYGQRAVVPAAETMTEDTIFDAASLTKVTATTPAVWILIERGKIGLDDPASKYIPEFRGGWRDEVTVRHLLTHTSGLRPDLDVNRYWAGYDTSIRLASEEMPRNRPGYIFKYSDINFELLGEIVHRASGLPLDEFATREVFAPLKMRDSGFRRCEPLATTETEPADPLLRATIASVPCRSLLPTNDRIAPTEPLPDGTMLRGVVHDPTARHMGGVAGHAGLFTTARDLARYARMLLNGGTLDGVRILKPETVQTMTSVLSPPNVAVRRTGGFDLDSGFSRPRGDLFPVGSYGHTGFTGNMLWIDPWSRTFYVFLSNRVHPNGKGNVTQLQRALGTLAAQSVADFDFSKVTNAVPVRAGGSVRWLMGGGDAMNGIDVLNATAYKVLQGQRIALLTNHTGIDRSGNPTVDLLRSAPGVQLVALFSPEHGIRGTFDENIPDTTDPASGLPIYSLYGERRKPAPAQLAGIDAIVFDVQDIGARFYTYISTLGNILEAAAGTKTKIIVLDRVNAIGGAAVEGPVSEGESTFVAYHPISIRHGMTVGELARMYKAEKNLDVQLDVIQIRGWKREQWQDEAGLPWINTSPNMRSLTEAGFYPGIGLLESAVSIGRGTATPFELVGAPYIDADVVTRELSALNLPGVSFAPVHFTPDASVFKGEACNGVRLTLTDRRALEPVRTGVAIATTLRRLYGDRFAVDKMDRLLRKPAVLEAIRAAKPASEIVAMWQEDEKGFRERRAKYLLY